MARVVDFEDGFTSETAPTDNDIATQAELDAHINDTTAVHAATSLSLPVTETLYVDKGRADTYTQTGSILAPYKTIQAAINAIQTAGDNSDSKPYRIEISAGYYAEDLVISGAGFINVILDGHGAVTVDKLTMSVADAFWTFVCLGMSFADTVSIIGTTDGGTAFASGGEFRSCNFYDVTLKNLCAVYVKDSAIGGPLVVENVISAAIQKGQATGTITNTWAPANPKPGGAPYSYLNLEALVTTGDITISAGAYVQTRIGSRIGLPGGTITVNGEFIAYSSYIRAGISVGATGVFTNSGSFYNPSTLTITPGGTHTNNAYAEVLRNVPSGNLAATNVQSALNELQTDVDTRSVSGSPVSFAHITTPSSPAAGYSKLYAKSDNNLYIQNSAGVETAVGSGSGSSSAGLKNYITVNPDLELGLTTAYSLGTATLTNAFPSGAPTFGSGAAGTLSLSAISSGQLAGSYSLGYTSSAATTAGNFVATDAFTVDLEGQAKVMQFKIAYKAVTNPSNGNFSGTSSNSFGVAIYDVTNSAWIQPAGVFNIVQSSGVGIATGTFQTSSNGTSYRLVFYNANASAGAITMYLDDFFVGPQITAAGAAISDAESFTPTSGTLSGSGTGKRWRVGDRMFFEIVWTVTSGLSANPSITGFLPSGLSVDTSKLLVISNRIYFPGAVAVDGNVGEYLGVVALDTPFTTVFFQGPNAQDAWTPTVPFTWANGDVITAKFNLPITSWSSNTVMSNDTDTRVIAAYATGIPASVTSGNPIIYPTVTRDTSGAYNSTTGRYLVQVPGFYQISIGGAAATGPSARLQIYNNAVAGPIIGFMNSTDGLYAGSGIVYANAGEQLDVRPSANMASFAATGSISINRLSGPATIAATESVNASYGLTSAQAVSANAIIKYDTKVKDTHNAYSTSTGLYTAPVSGSYLFTIQGNANGIFNAYYKVSGVDKGYLVGAPSSGYTVSGSVVIPLVAGDTVAIYSDAAFTFQAPSGGRYLNFLSVARVGN